jgi:hypothetical protein
MKSVVAWHAMLPNASAEIHRKTPPSGPNFGKLVYDIGCVHLPVLH